MGWGKAHYVQGNDDKETAAAPQKQWEQETREHTCKVLEGAPVHLEFHSSQVCST